MDVVSQVLLSAVTATLTTLLVHHVGSRYWLAQERWKFRADYHARLLQNLAQELEVRAWWAGLDEESPADAASVENASAEMRARSRELTAERVKLLAVADLWLGQEAREAITRFRKTEGTAEFEADNRLAYESCAGAVAALQRAARADLDLHIQ